VAFITTDQLDAFLGATDAALYSDEFKGLAVDVACDAVESYCGRLFAADDYREWYKSGGGCLTLRQFPLLALRRACVGTTTVGTLANSSTDAVSASGAVINNMLRLTVVGGANASDSALTLSAYSTMAALSAAVAALGRGWVLDVTAEESPRSIKPGVIGSVVDGVSEAIYGPGATVQATIDYEAAAILTTGGDSVYVEYRAGYEVIPSDLLGVACGMARDWLVSGTAAGAHDLTGESKRLGDFTLTNSYVSASTASGTSSVRSGLVSRYVGVLDAYRRLDWGIL